MLLVAALASAAALAAPAAATPPGGLRCNPAVHHLPCSRGMRVHVRYRIDLETSCGIVDAWFDGRLWVATPALTDGSDNPPRGWAIPWQRGTIFLTSRTRALFRSGRLVARFRVAPPTYAPPGCDAAPDGPPEATVTTASATLKLARGSFCWMTGRTPMCADMIPPDRRTDIPRLQTRVGDTLRFHLGFLPTDANLTLIGPDGDPLLYVPLPNEQTISWQVPSGLLAPSDDVLVALLVRARDGEASYLIWLHS